MVYHSCLMAVAMAAALLSHTATGMELVKPKLTIPKDSYEEFLIRGPVTLSYVANVLEGTKIDAVVLDKPNFIRFANKGDAEFNEEASCLDSKSAHVLHHHLGPGIHYLVIDNTKEFGETKPEMDVDVELSINVLSSGSHTEHLGEVVVPTWVAAVSLALIILGLVAMCGLGSLLCRGRGASGLPYYVIGQQLYSPRSKTKGPIQLRGSQLFKGPDPGGSGENKDV